ncbi:hypothetical protein BBAD15_g3704 [Beauveria bassiana D1-5]|uniref:Uncharacterized protein n=1 Tax=Beauveria bassiana D1-5 TaxID=1245745 RepID=A0A0A2WCY7_BEABA|nr:hypothetical protein BBAD15_g3704 [Beauveria bassiana D1-5]
MTNCTNAPPQAPSEPGVAGAGILLSFIITAGLALILSASVILAEIRGRPSAVRRKLLNGFSDSQIVQGIGVQSVALAKMGSLVPYHFFLVWMLSLLSMATHNATLLALVGDYRRDWVLRWLRQLLMFVNLALSSVSGVFVLQVVSRGMSFSTLPVACVWDNGGGGGGNALGKPPPGADGALSYVGTVAVLAGNLVIFGLATWYLHSRQQRWYKTVQVAGLLVMAAVAVGATVRVVLLSSAFGKPSVTLADEDEKSWSFGQLLSMLLLVLPLISAVEIYRGDVQMAPPPAEDADRLLDGGELQSRLGNRFQPNPFFGSKTNSFKK